MTEISDTAAKRWVLALTSAGSLMAVLDALVVATALNTMRIDLHASIEALEWTMNAYNLSFAVLLLTGAALGDRFGRRRMFVAGLVLFVAASAACALAGSLGWLIGARAVQGAGAALVMPIAMALLSATFPPQERAKALGIFSGVTGLALIVGPMLGGAMAPPGSGSSGSTSRSASSSFRWRTVAFPRASERQPWSTARASSW
jgi:MFS family permease